MTVFITFITSATEFGGVFAFEAIEFAFWPIMEGDHKYQKSWATVWNLEQCLSKVLPKSPSVCLLAEAWRN